MVAETSGGRLAASFFNQSHTAAAGLLILPVVQRLNELTQGENPDFPTSLGDRARQRTSRRLRDGPKS